jgi:hypothetical protein
MNRRISTALLASEHIFIIVGCDSSEDKFTIKGVVKFNGQP